MDEIRVRVVEFSDRSHYMMQYIDPITKKKKSKSTKVERTGRKKERTEAERVAAQWEQDLRAGRYKDPSRVTWEEFRDRYETEALASLAETTQDRSGTVLDIFETLVQPKMMRSINTSVISSFQSSLRTQGKAEATIKSYLGHIRAALNWAERVDIIADVPRFDMPKRAKGSKIMKGRPITTEEFERMIAKVTEVVGSEHAEAWKFYLKGLWWSGLRLTESFELSWDQESPIHVDMSATHPQLVIAAEAEKGNQDRLLPIAPEFAMLLESVPAECRHGKVFRLSSRRLGDNVGPRQIGKIVSRIGMLANVVVDSKGEGENKKVKFASAHDLRRAFGERWATRVMPKVLMDLMRHENIDTTMKFYVSRNAQSTSEILWQSSPTERMNIEFREKLST